MVKPNNKQSYTLRDFYHMYAIDYMRFKVPYRLYKRVLDRFNTIILQKLFSGSEELKMPFGLGHLCIIKYKPLHYNVRSLSLDFKLCKQYHKWVYFLNEHSDGYKYRLYWSRKGKSQYILQYKLSFVRQNKRKLAQIIKNKEHDYIELT